MFKQRAHEVTSPKNVAIEVFGINLQAKRLVEIQLLLITTTFVGDINI